MIPNALLRNTPENVERLLALLPSGRQNAVTADVIQRRLGLPDQRTAESVRGLIQYAIVEHNALIAGGPKGYWLIETDDEMRAYLENLDRRIHGIMVRRAAIQDSWLVRAGRDVPTGPGANEPSTGPKLTFTPLDPAVGGDYPAEAHLGNYRGGDGVRFTAEHYWTCYRRGPYKLLIEVAHGPNHHRWGCFDAADQPLRYYHSPEVMLTEAQTIANVLWTDRYGAKKKP